MMLPSFTRGKWFVSHQRAVSVWWQPLSGVASWKRGYLAATQWCWREEDTTEVKEHIEMGWCLRCQGLLPCCVEANGLVAKSDLWGNQGSAGLWGFYLIPICRSAGIVFILRLSRTYSNKYIKSVTTHSCKECTARDRAKSHNEKHEQREGNE